MKAKKDGGRQMGNLILASASPRRKELLEQAGIDFTVDAADVDEHITVSDPAEYVMELSRRKARAVAERRQRTDCGKGSRKRTDGVENRADPEAGGSAGRADANDPEEIILGADTVVVCDGRILGKPEDKADAVRMLKLLSGREHEVYTGVTLFGNRGEKTFYECTKVIMYDNDENVLWAYAQTGEPLDKAGAYGIQGRGALLVKGLCGDYNNVVGLPVARVARELRAYDGRS